MTGIRTGKAAADTSISRRARKALHANMALQELLTDSAPGLPILNILLFLAAEDRGGGVTTQSCCNAIKAPRTTTLRWIGNLVALQLVEQTDDAADRRITRLHLTARASTAIAEWITHVAGR